MAQLVLIHGRGQENRDALKTKKEWLKALDVGLRKSNLTLPIKEEDVRFPWYGKTLFDLAAGVDPDQAAEIIIKGTEDDARERAFIFSVLKEVQRKAGITDAQIAEMAEGDEPIEKGILNNRAVLGLLRGIDRFVPGGSGAAIGLATKDVYSYINDAVIKAKINKGVRAAITPGVPTVVVAHSLGTVVAYTLIKEEGKANGWNIPLLVTVGSPLSVNAIKKAVAPNEHPRGVGKWLNALDPSDTVALYPLDKKNFPIDPMIENILDVENSTENHHGISGYLDHKVVARRIHDALVAARQVSEPPSSGK
jgi:hypothetical protein